MKIPKKLSYQRSLSPSIAVFYSVDKEGKHTPLEIKTVKILGQKESASEAFDGDMNLKSNVENKVLSEGNPQTIDYCHAPADSEYLLCKFSLRVEASSLSPRVCDDNEVSDYLKSFAQLYAEFGGYHYLAQRYLVNILGAEWLWRNQNTINTDIALRTSRDLSIEISGVNQLRFEHEWWTAIPDWEVLLEQFSNALQSPEQFLHIEVSAKLKVGFAQEVYPSQAFTDKSSDSKSRVYQKTGIEDKNTAIIGAYKVGAAIACIDDWYEDGGVPVRVGRFGVDKASSCIYRSPEQERDMFSLLKKIESMTHVMQASNSLSGDAHFIAANLIKGGLFQPGKS